MEINKEQQSNSDQLLLPLAPPSYLSHMEYRFAAPPPSYYCTVYKQGQVRIKKELNVGGFYESKNRSWNKVYFVLRGTLLQIFNSASSQYPLYHLSMLKANCGMAPDYTKHKNVLRLRLGTTKEQFLIRSCNLPETISWFEHLQSSINISTDIDKRRMPRILTLSRGNNNRQRHDQHPARTVTLMVGNTQAIVPILKNNV